MSISLLRRLLMKEAVKDTAGSSGIMSINKNIAAKVEQQLQKYINDAMQQGVDLDTLSPEQLKMIVQINKPKLPRVIPADSPEGRQITEQLFGKRGEVVDMTGKKIDTRKGIMGGKSVEDLMESGQVTKGTVTKKSKKVTDREMFKAANERLTSDVDSIIKNIKSMEPITAMKEANSVIARKGKYKNLTPEQSKKILQDTEDHIFERDIPEEDFASGGRAGFFMGSRPAVQKGLSTLKEMLKYFGKKIFEVDARGRFVEEREFIKPTDGENLFTTLDIEAQQVAYDQMNNRRGAVVAIEIDSGSIVSYVSTPSFSTNAISNGISSRAFNALIQDNDKPFFDRASQGRYSPASTIKPAIALFGIENNIIDWDFSMEDPGYFILPEDQRVYRGWRKGGHGNVNLNKAMIVSSNTFFFSLAYKSDINKLIEHLSNFGFGTKVCADCFNPDKALLPTPEWKMNNLNFGWFKGDTVNLGVGQGYLSATPLQLAYYSTVLANKGTSKELSFINERQDIKNLNIQLNNTDDLDWKRLHQSMIGVIESPIGTAKRLQELKTYTVAAKSGTVELVSTDTKEDYKIIRENEGNRDHAIIIAFGPMPNPKYAVSVVIENGESGGSVAGPVAIAVPNSLIGK